MQANNLIIKGIKCDNPNCEFRNDNVEFMEYKDWLNKPCPMCGANLLTQKDLNATKRLIKLSNFFNKLMKPFMRQAQDTKMINVAVEMNGTGEVNFKLQDKENPVQRGGEE